MIHLNRRIGISVAFASLVGLSACGGDDTSDATSDDDGKAGGGGSTSEKGGSIDVVISGEEAGPDGFLFPTGSEVTIADGWELKFDHVLVTVGNVTLSENPDKSPSDQSKTDGVVAKAAGPWAVNLHEEGTVTGAGGEGKAVPLVTLSKQTEKGGKAFAADERYAFGYDILTATKSAEKVNLGVEAKELYDEMVGKKFAVYYVGTATFKGGTSCKSSDDSYDFSVIPKTVKFKLGFATPTSYVNCQNQDNQGDAFEGEEYQRGLATKANKSTLAQMTLHLEHIIFADVEHDPAIYFDQFAARLVGKPDASVLTMDDIVGVDPQAFTDGADADLPWRTCDGSDVPKGKVRGFEVGSVPVNPSASPAKALRDYRDYASYVQSTQGHLNGGEGLCFVKRNYPSPQ